MSNTLFKREEKRKVTFRMGDIKTKSNCVDKERTLMVYSKC